MVSDCNKGWRFDIKKIIEEAVDYHDCLLEHMAFHPEMTLLVTPEKWEEIRGQAKTNCDRWFAEKRKIDMESETGI